MSQPTPSQPSQPTKILLLGAGELGTAFLPPLLSLPNTSLTLGIRNPQKYTHLTNPPTSPTPHPTSSLTLLPLDLTSPSALLATTFSHYNILISATGFAQSPSTLHKLAHEVLEAGKVKKQRGEGRLWFFPWQWGVDYDVTGDGQGLMPLFGAQKAVRDLLREKAQECGVKWTVVSTGIFMSFLFEGFWGVVDRSKEADEGKVVVVRCLRDWDHGVTVTDVSDIGKILARIVAGDVEAENCVLYVAGDSIRYGELAELIERVTGKEVVRETWSVPYLEEEVRKDPEDGIKKYRLVFARDGVWWPKDGTVNHELGIQTLGLETYVERLFGKQK